MLPYSHARVFKLFYSDRLFLVEYISRLRSIRNRVKEKDTAKAETQQQQQAQSG